MYSKGSVRTSAGRNLVFSERNIAWRYPAIYSVQLVCSASADSTILRVYKAISMYVSYVPCVCPFMKDSMSPLGDILKILVFPTVSLDIPIARVSPSLYIYRLFKI